MPCIVDTPTGEICNIANYIFACLDVFIFIEVDILVVGCPSSDGYCISRRAEVAHRYGGRSLCVAFGLDISRIATIGP